VNRRERRARAREFDRARAAILAALADANESGEITSDEGFQLVFVHAVATRDGREPD
jgi:hypothetical protein